MNEQQNYEKIKRFFEQEHDFDFESDAQEKRYIEYALYIADEQYRDEHHYREYPDFSDFLNTHYVDSIVYGITTGDYEVN